MTGCDHTLNVTADASDPKDRPGMIHALEQAFPQYSVEDIEHVLKSPDFEHARCLLCDSYIIRLKENK